MTFHQIRRKVYRMLGNEIEYRTVPGTIVLKGYQWGILANLVRDRWLETEREIEDLRRAGEPGKLLVAKERYRDLDELLRLII